MSRSSEAKRRKTSGEQFDAHHAAYGDYTPMALRLQRNFLTISGSPQMIELRSVELSNQRGTLATLVRQEIMASAQTNESGQQLSAMDTRAIIFTGDPEEYGKIGDRSQAADLVAAAIDRCLVVNNIENIRPYVHLVAANDTTYPLLIMVGYNDTDDTYLRQVSNFAIPTINNEFASDGIAITLPRFT